MIKYFLAIFLAISLSACSLWPTKPDQIVYVDKVTKCKRSAISAPTTFPFDQAKKEMSLEDKTKLCIAELEIYRGYTKELEAALNVCSE